MERLKNILIDSLFIAAFEKSSTSPIETPLSNLSDEARILKNGMWHNMIYIYIANEPWYKKDMLRGLKGTHTSKNILFFQCRQPVETTSRSISKKMKEYSE